ncbi:hypothetical protein D3C86_993480 [compost metagenome]
MQPINAGQPPKPVIVAPAPGAPAARPPQVAIKTQRLGAIDEFLFAPGKQGEGPAIGAEDGQRLGALLDALKAAQGKTKADPATRVSQELGYHVDLTNEAKPKYERPEELKRDQAESKAQSKRADIAPGVMLQRKSNGGQYGIRQLRADSPFERDIPVTGLQKTDKTWTVPTIENPGAKDGKFDPFDYMPNIVFASQEDSFPVLPDRDGDGKTKTDADHYDHGVIGGKQALTGAFTVTKKGEYTVMTYSFYEVDNKFTNYHRGDSSTVSVYLKPDKAGKLKPEYLYTSWHYAGHMTAWDDLKKGPDGRPVVLVERGSHAVHPFGKKEALPAKGLWINGDGSTALNGKPLENRLGFVTPQANIEGARRLDLSDAKDLATMNTYFAKYPERTHPIHPVLFQKLGDLK